MDTRRWRSARALACAIVGSVVPLALSAQEHGTLVGVVVSQGRGHPIPGALVALDAGIRAAADDEGAFVIDSVPPGPYRIAAVAPGCHVGLGNVDVAAGEQTRIRLSVPLPEDAEDRLDAWTLGTRSLGESVKTLTGADIRRRNLRTVHDALRVMAPDMVGGETGQAGSRQALRNRGAPTITGDASPLVILDGIPIAQRSLEALASLDPADVELIEVMRGGAGGWRYGLQGANGVVRITTRDAAGGYARETPPTACAFTFGT